MELKLTSLDNIQEIKAGDILEDIIFQAAQTNQYQWSDNDIVVIAQKIVSKAENRFVNLNTIKPGPLAIAYSQYIEKDPRLIELILNESKKVIRTNNNLMIVEHKLGFICANAGIDHSNVNGPYGDVDDWVLLLPEYPDLSAERIKQGLMDSSSKNLGVIIIDSHGRAWRNGVVGVCIGISGIPGVIDKKGQKDRYGYVLRATEIGAADELAAAGSLLMGQGDESRPVIIARGFPYKLQHGSLTEILRNEKNDLFR